MFWVAFASSFVSVESESEISSSRSASADRPSRLQKEGLIGTAQARRRIVITDLE